MTKSVIEITLKNKSKKFLSLKAYPFGLVEVRSKATLFDTIRIAEIVSDWFWQNHWINERFDSRTCVQFKTRERS